MEEWPLKAFQVSPSQLSHNESFGMNERMNEKMNERMNEKMNERMNE